MRLRFKELNSTDRLYLVYLSKHENRLESCECAGYRLELTPLSVRTARKRLQRCGLIQKTDFNQMSGTAFELTDRGKGELCAMFQYPITNS